MLKLENKVFPIHSKLNSGHQLSVNCGTCQLLLLHLGVDESSVQRRLRLVYVSHESLGIAVLIP